MFSSSEEVFIALADPTRRQLLSTLAETSPRTATQLAEEFPMTRQGITKHLDILAEAGLVSALPQGRERRYSLTPGPLSDVRVWVDAISAKWQDRLLKIKELVETDEDF